MIQLKLPPDLYNWLQLEMARRGTEMADVVTDILAEYAKAKTNEFDITRTRTWMLCGGLEIAEPEPEYIIGENEQGVITNYSEHVTDCSILAMSQRLGIQEVFAFDEHIRQMSGLGVLRVP